MADEEMVFSKQNADGVRQWFFYDESYLEYGPYETQAQAESELNRYCKEVLGV